MSGAIAFLATLTALSGLIVAIRFPERLPHAWHHVRGQFGLFLRIPVAMFAASCVIAIIPPSRVGGLIGEESGFGGILVASAFGAITPGGPMVTFPVALGIWQLGAGTSQMVAFLAAWSIFAIHRILSYELPTMGGRFVLLRLGSAFFLPPLAGGLAALLMRIF